MAEHDTGRNDPCWCGSGKKYKKCHMAEDKATERQRVAIAGAVRWLQRNLLLYARDERFAPAIAAAVTHYWNDLYTVDNMEEMSDLEALRFFDWFIFDYKHEGQPRLLEQYREEKWEELAEVQQQVLTDWLEAGPATGYELLDFEQNLLRLRDFLTGEEITVESSSGRGNVEAGEIILGRVVINGEKQQFSTTAAYIPRDELGDIVDQMEAARAAYTEEHPEATHDDFLRAENVRIIHHALQKSEEAGRPPVARLDPDRDDAALRRAARLIGRRMSGRRR